MAKMKIRFTAVFILLSFRMVYPQPVSITHEAYMNLLTGMWYEVAFSPSDLRKDCHCTTIEFEYIQGKSFITMSVRYIQFKNQKSQILESHRKLYTSADKEGNMFSTGRHSTEYYQIVPVNNDNNMLVVYNSRHKHLHLLSRDAFVPVYKFNEAMKSLNQKGYNSSALQRTSQNCDIIE